MTVPDSRRWRIVDWLLRRLRTQKQDWQEGDRIGPLGARKMTRQEIALHSLQADFMRDADPDEWYELPGGTHEGQRIPDVETDTVKMTGCWSSRAVDADDV